MPDQTQTITIAPSAPDSGTCSLKFGDCLLSGITPANLATPSQIVSLLSAASRVFASGVTASASGLVDTFTFVPPVGGFDWPYIVADTTNLYISTAAPTVTETTAGTTGGNAWLVFFDASNPSNVWNVVDTTDGSACDFLASALPSDLLTYCQANGGNIATAVTAVTDAFGGNTTQQPYIITSTDPIGAASGTTVQNGTPEIQSLTALPGSPNRGTFNLNGQSVAFTVLKTTVQAALLKLLEVTAARLPSFGNPPDRNHCLSSTRSLLARLSRLRRRSRNTVGD